ncbi:D-3-phosphoglycerate dehydrogenase [Phytophthora idaei]|nr:D-3-phosphoglycerate dehydrogenase [Phytophthora idaei]
MSIKIEQYNAARAPQIMETSEVSTPVKYGADFQDTLCTILRHPPTQSPGLQLFRMLASHWSTSARHRFRASSCGAPLVVFTTPKSDLHSSLKYLFVSSHDLQYGPNYLARYKPCLRLIHLSSQISIRRPVRKAHYRSTISMLASVLRSRGAQVSTCRRFASVQASTPTAKAVLTPDASTDKTRPSDKEAHDSYLHRPVTYPLDKIKVVLLENIHPRAKEVFEREGYTVETHKRAMSGEELARVGGDAHILGIRSKTQLDPDFFSTVGWHEHRLWAVGCFCIGTNQVALPSGAVTGIPVFNAPFSNTRSVAEKTLSEIIALHRKLFLRSTELHQGIWTKSATGAHEVRGTTLGIVGYGRIGSQVSVLAELLGMKVVFYDPVKCLPLGNARQVDTLEELLGMADAVTLHVPATPTTKKMINRETIAQMKDGALLVNNARGTVIDIDAAKEAIQSGKIAGMAVDVFPKEPAKNGEPFDTPLRGLPNVILTPHIGGSTEEAQGNIAVEVATKLVRYINDGSTTTSTNTPEIDMQPIRNNSMRILHMHQNVPGVLSKIHSVLSDYGINVTSQYLQSDPRHGYIALEVEKFHAKVVTRELEKIKETIFLRTII